MRWLQGCGQRGQSAMQVVVEMLVHGVSGDGGLRRRGRAPGAAPDQKKRMTMAWSAQASASMAVLVPCDAKWELSAEREEIERNGRKEKGAAEWQGRLIAGWVERRSTREEQVLLQLGDEGARSMRLLGRPAPWQGGRGARIWMRGGRGRSAWWIRPVPDDGELLRRRLDLERR